MASKNAPCIGIDLGTTYSWYLNYNELDLY